MTLVFVTENFEGGTDGVAVPIVAPIVGSTDAEYDSSVARDSLSAAGSGPLGNLDARFDYEATSPGETLPGWPWDSLMDAYTSFYDDSFATYEDFEAFLIFAFGSVPTIETLNAATAPEPTVETLTHPIRRVTQWSYYTDVTDLTNTSIDVLAVVMTGDPDYYRYAIRMIDSNDGEYAYPTFLRQSDTLDDELIEYPDVVLPIDQWVQVRIDHLSRTSIKLTVASEAGAVLASQTWETSSEVSIEQTQHGVNYGAVNATPWWVDDIEWIYEVLDPEISGRPDDIRRIFV